MTVYAVERTQARAAKAAGFAYLLSFAAVVFAEFRIHDRLIVEDVEATARNILAHELLFRIGIDCDLLYCVGTAIVLTALYVILRPVSRGLAMLAAALRFVYMLAWVMMTINLWDALRVLRIQGPWRPAGAEAMANLYLHARFEQYYVGLFFCGLASTICGYLWLRSRYIPKALAIFGVLSSAFCAACTFVFIVFPHFDSVVNLWWFDSPMGLFDLGTSFWLLFRGLKSTAPEKVPA